MPERGAVPVAFQRTVAIDCVIRVTRCTVWELDRDEERESGQVWSATQAWPRLAGLWTALDEVRAQTIAEVQAVARIVDPVERLRTSVQLLGDSQQLYEAARDDLFHAALVLACPATDGEGRGVATLHRALGLSRGRWNQIRYHERPDQLPPLSHEQAWQTLERLAPLAVRYKTLRPQVDKKVRTPRPRQVKHIQAGNVEELRNQTIRELHRKGWAGADLARVTGLSSSRISQIVWEEDLPGPDETLTRMVGA